MTMFNLGATALNTGSYYGSGYSSVGGYSATGNRVASSMNLQRVARDIAQGYNADIEVIALYLQQGDTSKALSLYESLIDDVKESTDGYGYQLSDGQITSILNQAYANATGQSFTTSAVDGAHSPFVTGLLEGIPVIGLLNRGSSDAETLSKVTGTDTRIVDKVAEYAGSLVPGAAAGAAVVAGTALVASSPIVVPAVLIGAGIGAAIGAGQTFLKDVLGF